MGRRLGGPPGGFLSVLFLALTPVYYGHSFYNAKDIPFAAMYALATAAILACDEWPTVRWGRVVGAGVLVGLTAAIRVGGLVLFGFALALWLAVLLLRGGAPLAWPRARDLLRLAAAWGAGLAAGWAAMIAFWPWAMLDPQGAIKFSLLDCEPPAEAALASTARYIYGRVREDGAAAHVEPDRNSVQVAWYRAGMDLAFRPDPALLDAGWLHRPEGGYVPREQIRIAVPSTFAGELDPPAMLAFVLHDTRGRKRYERFAVQRRCRMVERDEERSFSLDHCAVHFADLQLGIEKRIQGKTSERADDFRLNNA
jgi:hypothetical protein